MLHTAKSQRVPCKVLHWLKLHLFIQETIYYDLWRYAVLRSIRLRKRWAVVRLLPKMQRVDVVWFYQYSDAEGYAKILRRLDPQYQFKVVFEANLAQRQSLSV